MSRQSIWRVALGLTIILTALGHDSSVIAQPSMPAWGIVEDQLVITPPPGRPLSQDGAILIAGEVPEGAHYELSWGGPPIRLRARMLGTAESRLTHLEPTMPLHPGTPYVLWRKASSGSTEVLRFETKRTRASIAKRPERNSLEAGGSLLSFDETSTPYVVIAMRGSQLKMLREPVGQHPVPCELGSFVVFDVHGRLVQPMREPGDACPEESAPIDGPSEMSSSQASPTDQRETRTVSSGASCGCRAAGSPSSHEPLGLALSVLLIGLIARRKRSQKIEPK